MDPSETYLVVATMAANNTIPTTMSGQCAIPSTTAAVTAIPFPPLKCSQHGKLCPNTVPNPYH